MPPTQTRSERRSIRLQEGKRAGYVVGPGQRIKYGRKEGEGEGDDAEKVSEYYEEGDEIELTEREAFEMRHALLDPPDVDPDADFEDLSKEERAIRSEAMRQSPGTQSGMPDFGRLPASRERDIMLRANKAAQKDANQKALLDKMRRQSEPASDTDPDEAKGKEPKPAGGSRPAGAGGDKGGDKDKDK